MADHVVELAGNPPPLLGDGPVGDGGQVATARPQTSGLTIAGIPRQAPRSTDLDPHPGLDRRQGRRGRSGSRRRTPPRRAPSAAAASAASPARRARARGRAGARRAAAPAPPRPPPARGSATVQRTRVETTVSKLASAKGRYSAGARTSRAGTPAGARPRSMWPPIRAPGSARTSCVQVGRVVGEVEAGAGADLQHRAAGLGQQLAPQRRHAAASRRARGRGRRGPRRGGFRPPRRAGAWGWLRYGLGSRHAGIPAPRGPPPLRLSGPTRWPVRAISVPYACRVEEQAIRFTADGRASDRLGAQRLRPAAGPLRLVDEPPRAELARPALPRLRRGARAPPDRDPLRPARHRPLRRRRRAGRRTSRTKRRRSPRWSRPPPPARSTSSPAPPAPRSASPTRPPTRSGCARLLLYGGYASGSAIADERSREAIVALVREHWGLGSRALADVFMPSADAAGARGVRRVPAPRRRAPSAPPARSRPSTASTSPTASAMRPGRGRPAPPRGPRDPLRARPRPRRRASRRDLRRPRRRRPLPLARRLRAVPAPPPSTPSGSRTGAPRPEAERRARGPSADGADAGDLTERETEVLALIADRPLRPRDRRAPRPQPPHRPPPRRQRPHQARPADPRRRRRRRRQARPALTLRPEV